MALSNIFREPRREIIETVLGVVVALPALVVVYLFGNWLSTTSDAPPLFLCYVIALMAVVVATVLGWGVLTIIHIIGEGVCEFMARRGADPRPRQRY